MYLAEYLYEIKYRDLKYCDETYQITKRVQGASIDSASPEDLEYRC